MLKTKIRAGLGRARNMAARVVADQDQVIGLWCLLCMAVFPWVLALPSQGGAA